MLSYAMKITYIINLAILKNLIFALLATENLQKSLFRMFSFIFWSQLKKG
jgi:hypothetical protein